MSKRYRGVKKFGFHAGNDDVLPYKVLAQGAGAVKKKLLKTNEELAELMLYTGVKNTREFNPTFFIFETERQLREQLPLFCRKISEDRQGELSPEIRTSAVVK